MRLKCGCEVNEHGEWARLCNGDECPVAARVRALYLAITRQEPEGVTWGGAQPRPEVGTAEVLSEATIKELVAKWTPSIAKLPQFALDLAFTALRAEGITAVKFLGKGPPPQPGKVHWYPVP